MTLRGHIPANFLYFLSNYFYFNHLFKPFQDVTQFAWTYFFQNLRKSRKLLPYRFDLPKVVSIPLQPQAAAKDEEDTVKNNTLAVNEKESEQESNEICKKKVNLIEFYQPLTVVNGIAFNYSNPVRHLLIQNVATCKWTDLDVLEIQVSLKKGFMFLCSELNYNQKQKYN